MTMRGKAPWPRLLAMLACSPSLLLSVATSGDEMPPSRRLELADGFRAGVVPVTLSAERSRWRPTARLDDPEADIELPTDTIVRWGACPPWPQGPIVLLADGGAIAGRVVAADATTVIVASTTFGRLTLPAAAVGGVRAGAVPGPGRLVPDAAQGDQQHRVLLANGDRVAARRIEWHDGAVVVELASRPPASATVAIPEEVVRAIDFTASTEPSGGAGRPPRILAAFMDGSRFAIAGLEPATRASGVPRIRLALRLGGTAMAMECDADELLAIAVDGGRASFLASLAPSAYEQTAEFGPVWPLARGHASAGDWPSLRGETAFTALGIHAPARVRYRLEKPATRFESRVAIDDSAGAGGSVIVRLLAGGDAGAGREVFSTPVLRGGEEPATIRVEFPATTELELVVEPSDGGDILDRTLWLDPLVVGAGQ